MKPPKPLKRGAPLRRSPLKRGTTPLPRESQKRKREAGARSKVKAAAMRRCGGRCELAVAVPEIACWHPAGDPLDCDEIAGRGRRPGGHLDVDNVQICCRAHHDWKTREPIEAARRGLAPWPRGYMGPEITG